MSKTGSEFLAEITQRIAASDAQVDADFADILARRPFKKRTPPSTVLEATAETPEPVKKPRAKRKPKDATT